MPSDPERTVAPPAPESETILQITWEPEPGKPSAEPYSPGVDEVIDIINQSRKPPAQEAGQPVKTRPWLFVMMKAGLAHKAATSKMHHQPVLSARNRQQRRK